MALLNLTNFDDHPTEPHWMVFRFGDRALAEEFQKELGAAGIAFEADQRTDPPYLIGVKQRHREAAVRINYTVIGRHRAPFIGNGRFRTGLLVLFILLLILAVMGWLQGR